MSFRRLRYLLMVALMAVYYGCHATDDAAVQESEAPKRQDAVQLSNDARKSVTETQAIQIGEAEVRKRVHIQPDNTLRSDATHYDPGEARCEQGGVHREGGWSVIVWLVPAESAGHWFVFVTDGGRVTEFVGGA